MALATAGNVAAHVPDWFRDARRRADEVMRFEPPARDERRIEAVGPSLRVTYGAGTAYVHLRPGDPGGSSGTWTIRVDDDITLDLDDEGRLVGLEVHDAASRLHPELLAEARIRS